MRSHNILCNVGVHVDIEKCQPTVILDIPLLQTVVKSIAKSPTDGFYILEVEPPTNLPPGTKAEDWPTEYVVTERVGQAVIDAAAISELISKGGKIL